MQRIYTSAFIPSSISSKAVEINMTSHKVQESTIDDYDVCTSCNVHYLGCRCDSIEEPFLEIYKTIRNEKQILQLNQQDAILLQELRAKFPFDINRKNGEEGASPLANIPTLSTQDDWLVQGQLIINAYHTRQQPEHWLPPKTMHCFSSSASAQSICMELRARHKTVLCVPKRKVSKKMNQKVNIKLK